MRSKISFEVQEKYERLQKMKLADFKRLVGVKKTFELIL